MSERVNIGGFMATVITFAFVFSTMYTMAFFYYQASGQTAYGEPLSGDSTTTSPPAPLIDIFGIFDFILNFASLLSPWVVVKLFIEAQMKNSAPILYQIIDMMLLRPIGWIASGLFINFILSRIPTISGEG